MSKIIGFDCNTKTEPQLVVTFFNPFKVRNDSPEIEPPCLSLGLDFFFCVPKIAKMLKFLQVLRYGFQRAGQ